jgi:hypothetical protein
MIPTPLSGGVTMSEKISSRHHIVDRPDGRALLFVDRHLIHDGYAPAFEFVKQRGLRPPVPDIFQPGMRRLGTEEIGDAVAKAIRYSR